jgi:hypothetical protein
VTINMLAERILVAGLFRSACWHSAAQTAHPGIA